eukprot:TRINITY_DN657_c0_g1_i2.p1 TRINITY_DN657_c0_g1~~TRINITY_DN657_c0_g1_i2.p1  ORF type:complete len:427 (-),score=161.25 TRINITY_DN657_c0_g1_i2:45-1325(-)
MRRDEIIEKFDYSVIDKIITEMKKSKRITKDITISKDNFELLVPSLELIYKTGQKLLKKSYKDYVIEDFHDWRKYVKHLWYQTTLLIRIWPEYMKGLTDEIGVLADHLGDIHDIDVFFETLEPEGKITKNDKYPVLKEFLLKRKNTLIEKSKPLGEKIYCEPPEDFVKRMRFYFSTWKKAESKRLKSKDKKKKELTSKFTSKKKGHVYLSFFNTYPCSTIHDIPLLAGNDKETFNIVLDTPKGTVVPYHVNLTSPLNPLEKSSKHFDEHFPFHSGFFPMTLSSTEGKNGPIKVCNLSENGGFSLGSVVKVKVVASFPPSQNSWNVFVLNADDPNIEKYDENTIKEIADWEKIITFIRKFEENEKLFSDQVLLGKEATLQNILKAHDTWSQYITSNSHQEKILSKENVTLANDRISKKKAKSFLKEK